MKRLGLFSLAILAGMNGSAIASNGPVAAAAPAHAGYRLIKTIPLPGDKGWDYALADSVGRRLYVTHGDRVMVVDLDSEALVGQVGPFQGIHGVALDRALGRGYVSDGKAGDVACFDLKTLAILATIPARKGADSITFDPATGRVFAFSGEDGAATVIDAKTNTVLDTIPLGGKPEFCAANGRGLVFVNLEDRNGVLTIDAKTRKILRNSPIAPGAGPAAMSLDVAGGNLFSGCRNQKAVVLDPATGKVKAVLPIGGRVDASVYDPGTGTVYHSCGDGTVWAAVKGSDGGFTTLAPILTKKGSRTMAVDLETHNLYLPAADFEAVPATTPHARPRMIPGTFAVLVFGL